LSGLRNREFIGAIKGNPAILVLLHRVREMLHLIRVLK